MSAEQFRELCWSFTVQIVDKLESDQIGAICVL